MTLVAPPNPFQSTTMIQCLNLMANDSSISFASDAHQPLRCLGLTLPNSPKLNAQHHTIANTLIHRSNRTKPQRLTKYHTVIDTSSTPRHKSHVCPQTPRIPSLPAQMDGHLGSLRPRYGIRQLSAFYRKRDNREMAEAK